MGLSNNHDLTGVRVAANFDTFRVSGFSDRFAGWRANFNFRKQGNQFSLLNLGLHSSCFNLCLYNNKKRKLDESRLSRLISHITD